MLMWQTLIRLCKTLVLHPFLPNSDSYIYMTHIYIYIKRETERETERERESTKEFPKLIMLL